MRQLQAAGSSGSTLVQDRNAAQLEQAESACGTGAITWQSQRHPCRVVAKRPARAQTTWRQDRASVAAISAKLRRCVLYLCRVLDSSDRAERARHARRADSSHRRVLLTGRRGLACRAACRRPFRRRGGTPCQLCSSDQVRRRWGSPSCPPCARLAKACRSDTGNYVVAGREIACPTRTAQRRGPAELDSAGIGARARSAGRASAHGRAAIGRPVVSHSCVTAGPA